MKKVATWILWVTLAVLAIDWSVIGIKLLDGNFEFFIEAYIGLACVIVLFACFIFRMIGSKCHHCGKIIWVNGAYCSHCGKKKKRVANPDL